VTHKLIYANSRQTYQQFSETLQNCYMNKLGLVLWKEYF